MSTELLETDTIRRLASALERDIRGRRLAPGERYLTAAEAARMLGVSTASCNRAMQLLARRNVLVRRRNRGTYIAQQTRAKALRVVRSLYILLSHDRAAGYLSRDAIMDGLWRVLPGVDLHFTPLPQERPVRYLQHLLKASSHSETVGILAITCTREVYTFLMEQTAPVVVLGSVDPDEEQLASIDGDTHQAGRLLAEHLLGRGHRSFLLLMSDSWRPGDNHFLQGVQEALEKAKLPVGALRVRSVPNDDRVIQQQVLGVIGDSPAMPAVICHLPSAPEALARAMENGALPPDLAVAFHHDAGQPPSDLLPFACTFVKAPTIDMVAMAGSMIAEMNNGRESTPRHVLLPVALRARQ